MINIKILGPGCANCKRLELSARKVVQSVGMEAEIQKVTDFDHEMADSFNSWSCHQRKTRLGGSYSQ